jgi:precorrin-6A synthase
VGSIRSVQVIGIGAGDPQFLTMQAISALNEVDVFFFIDKPNATGDLATLRTEICASYVTDHPFRIVHAEEVERDRTATDYASAVADWHERRADLYERLIRDELATFQTGAFLVWGEPGLYDGTLRIIDQVLARDTVQFDYRVIPGISSVQALIAAHRIPMNRIGEPVHITTGRRIAEGEPVDNTFVMLDAECAFRALADPHLDIYWGAYLGTPDQALVSGRLSDVSETIMATRADLRRRKGWIMDTYLLRRRPSSNGSRRPERGGRAQR